MLKQTVDILTSYEIPKKVCVLGNVAVARGAIEAGVNGVFAYPGTPSTEISEVFKYVYEYQNNNDCLKNFPELSLSPIYFEYSINEKIALEKAIAYSIGNKSALCIMKNVGMNVASDALMTITYQSIGAPLVIVVCDDPGCFSSSNEQDSRYWGKFATVPLLNPSNPLDAYNMIKEAFTLSGLLKLPVIVRMTTRVNHSRGIIFYNTIERSQTKGIFERNPQHINIPSRTATGHTRLLNKLNHEIFNKLNNKLNRSDIKIGNSKHESGIIASGVAWNYLQELKAYNPSLEIIPVLKINVIHPFPKKEVLNFINNGICKILVFEELDPIVEDEVRLIIQKNKLNVEISGKGFGSLSVSGEYNLDITKKALQSFLGNGIVQNSINNAIDKETITANLPPRPPTLCAGCPHRATFYALKLCIPRDDANIILCGDIGCFGLGALAPLQMIDTINHMGMSISMAQGLEQALKNNGHSGKIVALLGDGTFFHSGISSLLNAIYTKANLTVIIFDNRTIGMTGHQDHPGATHHTKYKQIEILPLVKGLGVDSVEQVNPFDIKDTFKKINNAMNTHGISVLIARSPCIFLQEFKEGLPIKKKIRVDETKCNTCYNHCDLSIYCSKEKSNKGNLARAKAKIAALNHINGQEQLCPANICNHGFYNSIIAGRYKEALELVRDKMLFSKVCGEICHRPCEINFDPLNFSNPVANNNKGSNSSEKVPIKKLKHLVSQIDENFYDFSQQIERAKNCIKKFKRVAIVGAGPAGLSSAYDLIQQGYDITIYEKQLKPGGMIQYIIPDFRVDKKSMEHEIGVLEKMGVDFKYNSSLGKDFSMEELSVRFDAVILATGMWSSVKVSLIDKEVTESRRFDAITFLRKYNALELHFKKKTRFLIIGGGNSAMDSSRAVKKMNPENEIIISCLETRNNMPAFEDEIIDTLSSGIQILPNTYVDKLKKKNGSYLAHLKSYDKKKDTGQIEFDYIITATGQKSDNPISSTKTDKSGRIIKTGFKNIFLAGDILSGNHISLIGAIGSGKKAAVDVRKFLENYSYEYEGKKALENLNYVVSTDSQYQSSRSTKNNTDTTTLDNTLNMYNLYQPCAKCDHCIENFGCPALIKNKGKVHIDETRCNHCGLCIEVCPNGAIGWMSEYF